MFSISLFFEREIDNTRSEKRQRADFDAFAGACVTRRGGIVEGGVGGPAGAAVFERIVDLEHDRLLAPHAREPEPFMRGVVGDSRAELFSRCTKYGQAQSENKDEG